MPGSYRIALFIHLCALIAAAVASTLAHFASARQRRARYPRDAAQWHAIAAKAELIFPFAILTFFATGGYMVHAGGAWSWSDGFVVDGIIGAASLFVLGGYIGSRRKAFAKRLDEHARLHPSEATAIKPDAIADTIAWMCSGLALAVACVMTIKPAVASGIAVLIAGLVAGALTSRFERNSRENAVIGTSAASGGASRLSA